MVLCEIVVHVVESVVEITEELIHEFLFILVDIKEEVPLDENFHLNDIEIYLVFVKQFSDEFLYQRVCNEGVHCGIFQKPSIKNAALIRLKVLVYFS